MATKSNASTKKEKEEMILPREVRDIDLAFPTSCDGYLTQSAQSGRSWSDFDTNRLRWAVFFRDAWYDRMDFESCEMIPREGIDAEKAWRHIRYVMGSYAIKQEIKQAGVAILLELWFEEAIWMDKGGNVEVAVSRELSELAGHV